jgi:GTP-binding protein Era
MEEKTAFNEEQFKKDFEESFKNESKKMDEIFKQKLVISLLGDVNVGKSSTINALTGKKLADVGAFAGLTTEVYPHPYSENVIIADTPGLSDINQEVSKKARDFIHKDADIIMFFFNAGVGPTRPMIDTFLELKKLEKPIITILNKIDYLDEDELETVMSQIVQETGEKVIPIAAKKNIGIEKLNDEIVKVLESVGKDLLYLKVSKFKESKVKIWINGAAVSAFGIGIIPIPGADIIPLTSLQVGVALRIAYIYNCEVTKNDVMSLIASTITGGLGKQLFKYGVQALKGLGWFGGPLGAGSVAALGGTIAASITYGFGWACNAYYKSGMEMDLGELGEIYQEKYKQYYKQKKEKEVATV